VDAGGGVKCWGDNTAGQLGNGTNEDSHLPLDVSGLTSGMIAVAAGGWHSCALTGGGGVKCWGANQHGELGDGSTQDSVIPVEVSGLTSGVAAVTAGDDFTCAVTIRGGVKCWGNNSSGQLGNGTSEDSNVPVDVRGLENGARSVAAGRSHACAVTGAGGVMCWGDNFFEKLGTKEIKESNSPLKVTGMDHAVRSLALGEDHSCALTELGSVKCWGDGIWGQLGGGKKDFGYEPVDVIGLAGDILAIAAGGDNTCALTSGGGVKCWGQNSAGQLGNGSPEVSTIPVDVSGLGSGVQALSVGRNHSCVWLSGEGMECWGQNWHGELGNGTTVDSNIPVNVGKN
jgi:alpha-tubulin suppressor-like RCC1 family protein